MQLLQIYLHAAEVGPCHCVDYEGHLSVQIVMTRDSQDYILVR